MSLPPVANAADLPSPALLIYRERVEENLRRMMAIAGDPARLRPHVKTHKLPELVRRQLQLGIERYKCATIAEAEMTALAGAPDVLLALQPVGPQARRFADLVRTFPRTRFSTVVDAAAPARDLGRLAPTGGAPFELLLDLDVGQHRTGIAPGPAAAELALLLRDIPGVAFGGLHAYDGHLHDSDPEVREAAAEAAFAPVAALRETLEAEGVAVPRLVVGGTPTFPFHARRTGVECSPGTCVLWDAGYARKLPDLDFLPAAVLLTRVVSRPTPTRLCLDLGHKAVASEMPHPRVVFPDLPEAIPVAHNEEHLVLETPAAALWNLGDILLGIPWHICPTVALHAEVWVVETGTARQRWDVAARARRLSI
jgi:D-serine deaminase-like pyridoxal phosphate-dependent protein